MSRYSSTFTRLEKFAGNKYPIFIKNILEACGYDHESTLNLLNENSIKQIEREVDERKNLVKGTVYENKDGPFHFLIGHKELILSIPNTLKKLSAQKKSKNLEKKKGLGKKLDVEIDSEAVASDRANQVIERINKYFKSKKLNCVVNGEHIKLITLAENCAKCVIKCVFCDSEVTCTFDKHWNIANYTAHIRKHPQKLLPAQRQQKLITSPSGSSLLAPRALAAIPSEIQRGNSSVLSEVENILR